MSKRASKTKTEIRQEQIAQAALALVSRHGLRRLNVAGLARQVGVVPSALYRHYQSKEDVLEAVLDLISRRLLENVQAVRQESADPLECLHRLLSRHVQLICDNVAIPRVIFSEEIFSGYPRRRRRVYQIIQGYLKKVQELIREGQLQGRIRPDLAPDTGSVMFLGLVQPAAILGLMSNGAFDVAGHAEEAWRLFSGMLQAGKEGRRQNYRMSISAHTGQGTTKRTTDKYK
jgi:AcrR family transcriptional regulator